LTEVAERLAVSALSENPEERDITLLAVSVSKLSPEHSLQMELPLEAPGRQGAPAAQPQSVVEGNRWGVDRSMDAIRDKFGRTAVGYAAVALSSTDRVPDEFRQLAERGPGRDEKGNSKG
jgi:DNA polymerase-4